MEVSSLTCCRKDFRADFLPMLVDDAPGPRTATPSFSGEAALAVLIWAEQRREATIHAVCFVVEALEDFRARV